MYWEYDKDDLSLRLDSFSGTLDDILIEATLSSTSRSGIVSRSGMQVPLRRELRRRRDDAASAALIEARPRSARA